MSSITRQMKSAAKKSDKTLQSVLLGHIRKYQRKIKISDEDMISALEFIINALRKGKKK